MNKEQVLEQFLEDVKETQEEILKFAEKRQEIYELEQIANKIFASMAWVNAYASVFKDILEKK